MNLKTYEKYCKTVVEDLEKRGRAFLNGVEKAKMGDVVRNGRRFLKNHDSFLKDVLYGLRYSFERKEAIQSLQHILNLLSLVQSPEIKPRKSIFADAEEKLAKACTAFDQEEYGFVYNACNSAIELALKEDLGIPPTISKIKTSNVIEVLIKEKNGPVEHLAEIKKHVFLDNSVKHEGFEPNPKLAIKAIKATHSLIKELKKKPLRLSDVAKDKIFDKAF